MRESQALATAKRAETSSTFAAGGGAAAISGIAVGRLSPGACCPKAGYLVGPDGLEMPVAHPRTLSACI